MHFSAFILDRLLPMTWLMSPNFSARLLIQVICADILNNPWWEADPSVGWHISCEDMGQSLIRWIPQSHTNYIQLCPDKVRHQGVTFLISNMLGRETSKKHVKEVIWNWQSFLLSVISNKQLINACILDDNIAIDQKPLKKRIPKLFLKYSDGIFWYNSSPSQIQ